jgi:erythromycin esterase-like protein
MTPVGNLLSPADAKASRPETVARLIREVCEPVDGIAGAELGPFLDRVGDARVVLLGEASHGTSEFYRMRERMTRELITKKGFNLVAVEADWPDARWVDHYVRHAVAPPTGEPPFTRFPTWMWRNREFAGFSDWLREHNAGIADPEGRTAFYGLDLYSLYRSIGAVLHYLESVDPPTARLARERYGCLWPWREDPAAYGHAAVTAAHRGCEGEVVAMLRDLLDHRLEFAHKDGDRFLDAVQNARLVANAERYYRIMYYGSVASWNLRDEHMFDTLMALLEFHGPDSRAVVWEHNSHIGDAAATEMGARGEFNVGHLARAAFGPAAYLVGFGTDHGTVAAASNWDEPMQVESVRPAHPESYERLCHDAGVAAFLLPLGDSARPALREELSQPRLERAIGVIYRPETELASHYFSASLPRQFDEYAWFDETRAVTPVTGPAPHGVPDTYPFGL